MEDFSQLDGGGGGTPRGSFLYLPLTTTASTVTTITTTGTASTAPPTPSASAIYGRSYGLLPPAASASTTLSYPQSSRFNAEAGSSHRRTVEGHGEPQVDAETIKAKIVSHPQYSTLLGAFMDCQKVGAPPNVVERLSAVGRQVDSHSRRGHEGSSDPELDQFMEAYCNMLVKYREELTRPLKEATDFLKRIEAQFNSLTSISSSSSSRLFTSEKCEGFASSEDDPDASGGEAELPEIDPRAEDKELKHHLLKKYSGHLGSLRQELSKKRKKGKLPKEARQKLLNWWELHYKWPYPSESEKVALAESTGLDQKQINNWFINQRKRHWKPSEDMQFVVMDGFHPHNAAAAAAALFMERQLMGDGMYHIGP